MSMTLESISKMLDAGFTADEIRVLDTDGLFTYAEKPDPEPAPEAAAPEPAPKAADPEPAPKAADPAEGIDDLKKAINDGFKSIIEAFQVSAVGGSKQNIPTAKTSEDILAEIISPYTKPEGGKI